jgi:hypothetical protein
MKAAATAAICLALALVTFFQYPGHTWLQQDSQIYAPILENQHDPAVLRNDILAQNPHLAFTLYDEIAQALRGMTGLGYREILEGEQIVTRAVGIWGLFLIATALGLPAGGAWLVATIASLGALITGPQVLTFEYEPTPRAFALPLVWCAIGLTAHGRYAAAGIAGAVAFLYHPPAAMQYWLLIGAAIALAENREGPRRYVKAFAPLAAAVVLLLLFSHGPAPRMPFFSRLSPLAEQLQRMRTAYVWISTWPRATVWQYPLLFAIVLAAGSRIRRMPRSLAIFAYGLCVLGLLAMPLSWLLLEKAKLAIIPEAQPLRVLLFLPLMAQILTAAAGVLAAEKRRLGEAAAWFAVAYAIPLPLLWRPVLVAALLGGIAALAARKVPALGVAAFFALPLLGGVVNYPRLHTPELAQLSQWARGATPRDAVFLFPDAGHGLAPGIFRAEALRAIYVDWKGGGQINYLPAFGEQWWFRWQQTVAKGFHPDDLPRYDALGIQYIVVRPANRMARRAAFENGGYVVYPVR